MAKTLYKVVFHDHGKICELFARQVSGSEIWGFVAVRELVFDAPGVVVDPAEERLREAYADTRVLHLPMHALVRIEEVGHKGQAVLRDAESGERIVTPFPLPGRPR